MGRQELAEPPKPALDEATHRYSHGGATYPSVTGILRAVGIVNYSAIPAAALEKAALRGKYAHLAAELDDKGQLDESTLDDALRPYLAAWRSFRAELHRRDGVILQEWIERPMVSIALGYAGTVDRIVRIDGEDVTLDIKTGKLQRWTGVQLAAYDMIRSVVGRRRIGIELRKDGTFEWTDFRDEGDTVTWLAALRVYQFTNTNK